MQNYSKSTLALFVVTFLFCSAPPPVGECKSGNCKDGFGEYFLKDGGVYRGSFEGLVLGVSTRDTEIARDTSEVRSRNQPWGWIIHD